MPDTVSMIRAERKALSVDVEKQQHTDWVKQEAQLLMDELFVGFDDSSIHEGGEPDTVDVDWVEGLSVPKSTQISQTWASLDPELEAEDFWIPQTRSTPFYQRFLMILGGLAIITPLGLWGMSTLKSASKSRSVIAATPLQTTVNRSDADFAEYAEQALRQIETTPQADKKTAAEKATPLGITSLPAIKIGDRAVPPSLPPVVTAPQKATASTQPAPNNPSAVTASAKPAAPTKPKATQAELDRLALRVFKPDQAVQSQVPTISSSTETTVTAEQTLPAPPAISSIPTTSTITPAPGSNLPTLAANTTVPNTIAAAAPMSSPESASKKVIGIIELGLQSTLMVSNNGSHLNFQVGDIVNDSGWKLVQIAQGKAVLQKGTEYKTLSEGQFF